MANSFMNDNGEPYMTAAELRFEAALDEQSWHEAQDDYMARYVDDGEPLDPHTCPHHNWDSAGREVECRDCDLRGVFVVKTHWSEWGDHDAVEDFILWAKP